MMKIRRVTAVVATALTVGIVGSAGAASGTLDASFGTDGRVAAGVLVTGLSSSRVADVLVQHDGKVVVLGTSSDGNGRGPWTILRLNSDGTRDTSFGTNGVVAHTVVPGSGYCCGQQPGSARVIARQGDKYVLGGSFSTGDGPTLALARLNADGSLDTSFGASGTVWDPGRSATFFDVVALSIGPDGAITAAGSNRPAKVARFSPDGAFDDAFQIYGQNDMSFDLAGIATQADGSVLAAARYHGFDAADARWERGHALVKFAPDGSQDSSFGVDGYALNFVDAADSYDAAATAVAGDGSIVTVGSSEGDLVVVRSRPDGSLDAGFGGGIVRTDLGSGEDTATAVAIAGDKVLVAGLTNGEFVLARYDADGTLDESFGSGGLTVTTLDGSSIAPEGLAVDGSGRYVLAGTVDQGFTVLRYLGAGAAPPPPGNAAPTAAASVAPSSGTTATSFAFSATGSDPDGDALTYSWSFGDGSTGSGSSIGHAYAIPGSYTATVNASDGRGGLASATASVTVTAAPAGNAAPTVSASATPTTGTTATSFAFTTTASDADGDPLSYSWSFGDGSTGSGSSVSHTYGSPGSYTATVTVADGRGGTATSSASVTVSAVAPPPPEEPAPNRAPVADFVFTPASPSVGQSVAFRSTATDPDGDALSAVWSFAGEGTATGTTATHAFATAGSPRVTLTVSDGRGGTHSRTIPVPVVAARPDLTVGAPQGVGSWIVGSGSRSFSVVARNVRPSVPVGTVVVSLRLSSDPVYSPSDRLIGAGVATLGSQASATVSLLAPRALLVGVQPGSYWLFAVIDSAGVVAEADETNNVSPGRQVAVLQTPRPDLVAAVESSATVVRGGTLSVAVSLRNAGTAAAGTGARIELLRSVDDQVSADDMLIWQTTTRPLAVGARFTLTRTVTATWPPGNYRLLVVADPLDAVDEENETNNVDVARLQVLDYPKLSVSVGGTGSGLVSGTAFGFVGQSVWTERIQCDASGATPNGACVAQLRPGVTMTLSAASPGLATTFGGWTGCDSVTVTPGGGTCLVVMGNNDRHVEATFSKVAAIGVVSVAYQGSGFVLGSPGFTSVSAFGGTVQIPREPYEITCGNIPSPFGATGATRCSTEYPLGVDLALWAFPADGGSVRWTGCASTRTISWLGQPVSECTARASAPAAAAVGVEFVPPPKRLTVNVLRYLPPPSDGGVPGLAFPPTGSGKVVGNDVGVQPPQASINCGTGAVVCAVSFEHGQVVTLTARPDPGWGFAGWGGACMGTTTLSCSVTMTEARNVDAIFTLTAKATLRVAVSGAATDQVFFAGLGAGVACTGGNTCDFTYGIGQVVVLAVNGSSGVTWTGCDAVVAGFCQVTVRPPAQPSSTLGSQVSVQFNNPPGGQG